MSFSFWFISLSLIISSYTYVVTNVIILSSLWQNSIPLYIWTSSLSIYLSVDICFHILAIVNSAAMNIGCRFFKLIYFNYMLITLQNCSGFCHTLTWISHGCTCVPHPEALFYLPPHHIPQGQPSAPALSTLSHASKQVSFRIIVFSRYMPRSGDAKLYDNSIFSFLRNCHVVFHKGWNKLYSHQQCRRVPFSSYSHKDLLFVDFLIMVILTSVRYKTCYLRVSR